MRNRFVQQLDELNRELIAMAARVEGAILLAVEGLMDSDADKARRAIDADGEIDELERDIERRCLKLLLSQQPVASDLRRISTALKMITDMERIGDHAEDISEITLRLLGPGALPKPEPIRAMARETTAMLSGSIDAFVRQDQALAEAIIARDDAVDGLFGQVQADLLAVIAQQPARGAEAMDLMMVAKYFERIGDHAVNLAEWAIFSLTGLHKAQRIL